MTCNAATPRPHLSRITLSTLDLCLETTFTGLHWVYPKTCRLCGPQRLLISGKIFILICKRNFIRYERVRSSGVDIAKYPLELTLRSISASGKISQEKHKLNHPENVTISKGQPLKSIPFAVTLRPTRWTFYSSRNCLYSLSKKIFSTWRFEDKNFVFKDTVTNHQSQAALLCFSCRWFWLLSRDEI